VILAALYLLLRALLAHATFRDRIAGLSALLALGIGVAFVAACVGRWVDWWEVVGALRLPPLRPYSESLTYGNPSAVMTMSVLLTAAAAAHLGLGTRGRRVAVIGLVALAAAVTLLSGSRAGWLAVGVAILVVALARIASPAGRRALRGLLGTRSRRLGVVALAVAGGAAGLVLAPGSSSESAPVARPSARATSRLPAGCSRRRRSRAWAPAVGWWTASR